MVTKGGLEVVLSNIFILQHLQKQPDCAYNLQFTLGSVRVHNTAEVESEIESISPTHIICAIGRTHGTMDDGTKINNIDYLESLDKTMENVHDNLFAPMMLSLLATKRSIHLTYIGSGCIFSYENDEREFDEDDKPNFFGSQYSIIKGFTDQLMQTMQYQKNILNLRIRAPVSDEMDVARNMITKLVSYKLIINKPSSITNL
eukprot:1120479_1